MSEDQNNGAVKLGLTQIFDKRSALFLAHGIEVLIDLDVIGLRIDAKTILHLRPFLDAFLAYTLLKDKKEKKAAAIAANTGQGATANQNPFADIPLTLQQAHQLSQVDSMRTAMHVRMESTKSTNKTKSGSGETGLIFKALTSVTFTIRVNELNIETLRSADIEEKGAKDPLESVYMMRLSEIKLSMAIVLKLLSVDVTAQRMRIDDTRAMAQDYAHKVMLTTDFDRSRINISNLNHSLHSSVKIDPRLYEDSPFLMKSKGWMNENGTYVTVDERQNQSSKPEKPNMFFSVVYKEEAPNRSRLDLVISNATLIMAVDTFLDALHVSMMISFAVIKLVTICEEREAIVSDRAINDFENYLKSSEKGSSNTGDMLHAFFPVQSNLGDELSSKQVGGVKRLKLMRPEDNVFMEIHVKNPVLIILDDPAMEDTRALLGTANVKVIKNVVTYEIGRHEVREVLDVTVNNIEGFVIGGMQAIELDRIIRPIEVTFHCLQELVIPTSSDRTILSADVALTLGFVDINVAVADMFLMYSAAMRYTLAKEWSASRAVPGSIYDTRY